jgi:hypothetical protein
MIRVRLLGLSLTLGRGADPYEAGFKSGWQSGLFKALEVQQQTARERLAHAVDESEQIRIGARMPPTLCKECRRELDPPADPKVVSLDDVRSSLEVLLRRTPPAPKGLHVNGTRQAP